MFGEWVIRFVVSEFGWLIELVQFDGWLTVSLIVCLVGWLADRLNG